MSDDDLIIPALVVLIFVTSVISLRIKRWLVGYCNNGLAILVAGTLPIVLLVCLLGIWHYFVHQEYLASGSQDGYMGPLLILLYGFPYFIFMWVINLLAASSFRKKT